MAQFLNADEKDAEIQRLISTHQTQIEVMETTVTTLTTRVTEREAEVTATAAALKAKSDDMDETIALKNQAIADLATELERYQKKVEDMEEAEEKRIAAAAAAAVVEEQEGTTVTTTKVTTNEDMVKMASEWGSDTY